mmetsp:Transcript_16875/g.28188  ORF Transcript_16875/g.28188 Transcript_16875/m.28188 type:complete len:125 (+) Transcript_16875:102-476(+)
MRQSLSVETNKQSQMAECPSPPPDRPKTSRGVQSPSPDQFTSYVVPSPKFVRQLEPQKEASVMSFHSRGADSEEEEEHEVDRGDEQNEEEEEETDESASSDSLSGPFSEAHLFSCWLFGVALRA